MNLMTYKGYQATVTFDEGADLHHGEVMHLRDVITFQSKREIDLPDAFAESVADYLRFCAERGEEPHSP